MSTEVHIIKSAANIQKKPIKLEKGHFSNKMTLD